MALPSSHADSDGPRLSLLPHDDYKKIYVFQLEYLVYHKIFYEFS